MISIADYFGTKITHADCTASRIANAETLLARVNALLADAYDAGAYDWPIDPDTGTCISGARGGAGDGGFRLSTATTGRPGSSHKEGEGVDVYDHGNRLDAWLSTFEQMAKEGAFDWPVEERGPGSNAMLEKHGLYREHSNDTPGWCHLQTRRPGSGRRTFKP